MQNQMRAGMAAMQHFHSEIQAQSREIQAQARVQAEMMRQVQTQARAHKAAVRATRRAARAQSQQTRRGWRQYPHQYQQQQQQQQYSMGMDMGGPSYGVRDMHPDMMGPGMGSSSWAGTGAGAYGPYVPYGNRPYDSNGPYGYGQSSY